MTSSLPPQPRRNAHSHFWLVGLLGVAAGLFLMLYVPRLGGVARSLILFAGFHLVGAIVVATSLLAMSPQKLLRRGRASSDHGDRANAFDFGWGPGWMNGLAVAALICFAGATALEVAAPTFWPLAFLLVGAGVLCLVGNAVMRSFRRSDHVVLPMVDLVRGDSDVILDAGCGAGRTTIALSRMLRSGRVVAVDRFDASYIDRGGADLLQRNLRLAGLSERVEVHPGDLTALTFGDATFDAAVSTHVYDHLGARKADALKEMHRVLKPGARFLMAVWTPGWTMFAVANVLSFFLTSKAQWRSMAKAAGFDLIDEGIFNHAWFVLLQKPGTPRPEAP